MYLVIEMHGGARYASICTDINGENAIFNSYAAALQYANDLCHDGVVVEIG